MKNLLLVFLLLPAASLFSQLRQKRIEKKDGTYVYCYHKNGRISTEEFHSGSSTYMAQGYAKAFDPAGVEIYSEALSRTGLLSSVSFSYYPNGAVREAHYSAHPDGGIQWYTKTTSFDESGKMTGETNYSYDDHVTLTLPDSITERLSRENAMKQTREEQEKRRIEQERHAADSIAFYKDTVERLPDGTICTYIPDPEHGTRQQVIRLKGNIVASRTETFRRTSGIQSIARTYHRNGRVHEESIYEMQTWHYRRYDRKGHIVEERLNQALIPAP